MRTIAIFVLALGALVFGPVRPALAHCQIPCGIYDDPLRVKAMLEDVATIRKATGLIQELSAKKARTAQDENQIVRWVNAKEEHADRIQHVVLQYFLAQRIKPADEKDAEAYGIYTEQLAALHSVVLLSMKAKQEVNDDRVRALREAILEFAHLYLPERDWEGLE